MAKVAISPATTAWHWYNRVIGKGKTAEGIYAIEGDNLRLCYSLPGQKRPITFDPKDSEGHQNSFVFKRLKEKKE